MKTIHPFPARMAPEIAIQTIRELKSQSRILDPFVGSGTVTRCAVVNGHQALGYDLDPLAVLMARVWAAKCNYSRILSTLDNLVKTARSLRLADFTLPWIDSDLETKDFTEFWFERKQRNALRKLTFAIEQSTVLNRYSRDKDVFRLAFSRLIIAKKRGASVAWDVSHSRPHRKTENNSFDVFEEFRKSTNTLLKRHANGSIVGKAKIRHGDARYMKYEGDESVDLILSSPPYLNAIDYFRGHKLSLVWFGYKLSDIRTLRASSVGTERGLKIDQESISSQILLDLKPVQSLPPRERLMVQRYSEDACQVMREASRVLRKGSHAILVVGDSTIKGSFIQNSKIFTRAAQASGLVLTNKRKREIPISKRYLPVPDLPSNPLSKRMREEVILQFLK